MHASLWWFRGDPDDLPRRYEAMLADIPPAIMRLHLCLRADEGIVFSRATFPELRRRHGLPDPERVEDHGVHAAFVDGERRAG